MVKAPIDSLIAFTANIARMGIRLVETAGKAIEFRQAMGRTLSLLEGDKNIGAALGKDLDKLADTGGARTAAIVEQYQQLKAAGAELGDIQNIISAGMDLGAAFGKPEKGKVVVDTIGAALKSINTLNALGSFSISDELAQIINLDTFKKNLAAAKGITVLEVQRMMDAGTIKAKEGANALIKTISDMTGQGGAKVGEFAKKFGGNSLDGSLNRIKNQIDKIFADGTTLKPFTDALQTVADLLDESTESGQGLRKVFQEVFGNTGDLVKELFQPENVRKFFKSVESAGKSIAGIISDLANPSKIDKFIKSLTEGIDGFSKFGKAIGPIAEAILTVTTAVTGFKTNLKFIWDEMARGEPMALLLGGALAALFAPILLPVVAFMALAAAVEWVWKQLKAFWKWLSGDALKSITDFGSNIADGMWQGIKDGFNAMLDKFKGLINLLPAAVKKILGIASPSRVMMELGG